MSCQLQHTVFPKSKGECSYRRKDVSMLEEVGKSAPNLVCDIENLNAEIRRSIMLFICRVTTGHCEAGVFMRPTSSCSCCVLCSIVPVHSDASPTALSVRITRVPPCSYLFQQRESFIGKKSRHKGGVPPPGGITRLGYAARTP